MLNLSPELQTKMNELRQHLFDELGFPVTSMTFYSHEHSRGASEQEQAMEITELQDNGFENLSGGGHNWLKAEAKESEFIYFYEPEVIQDCEKCGATIGTDEYCDTCAAMEAEEAKALNKEYENALL